MTHRAKLIEARLALREAADLLHAAERHWEEMAPGMKAQSFGDDIARHRLTAPDEDERDAGTYHLSDPTGAAATLPDQARQDQERLSTLLRELNRKALEVKSIIQHAAVEKPLLAKELQQLAVAADPGCEIVGRIERPAGGTYWAEVQVESDVRGVLPRSYRLGSWAYKFVQRHLRLPTDAETRAHCEGRRVMVKAS